MLLNRCVVSAAVSLALAGSITLTGCKGQEQAQPQQLPEVTVVTIKQQTVPITTELAGRTSAYLVSEVRPQVNGIVQRRLFTEGSDVQAGTPLYQIDPATYQADLNSARASLSRAEANVAVARAKASRYRELVGINAVSKQEYDEAVAALKQAQADVASGKAAVDSARINVNYTHVTAPISGRIGKSSVTPGALVTANQANALTSIQQLDPIYVDVTQSSNELLKLKRQLSSGQLQQAGAGGARVKLSLDDGSVYPQEGTLQFSDVTVDQSTGSITIRAVFPNPNHDLLPGMYVRAVLETAQKEQAILVPQQGVTRTPQGTASVLVVAKDGSVSQREITTISTQGDKWLVSSGLKSGEQVIIEGSQRVRIMPGAPAPKVTPIEAGAKPKQAAAPAAPAK